MALLKLQNKKGLFIPTKNTVNYKTLQDLKNFLHKGKYYGKYDPYKTYKLNKAVTIEVTKIYHRYRLRLEKHYIRYGHICDESLDYPREEVSIIERIIYSHLDSDDKFIIENEVINGKTKAWYLDCMSRSTYEKHRRKAYANFRACLEE